MPFNPSQKKLVANLCAEGILNVEKLVPIYKVADEKVSLSFLSDPDYIDLCEDEVEMKNFRKYVCVHIKRLQELYDVNTIPDDISDGLYLLLVTAMPELKDKMPVRDVAELERRLYGE